MDCSPSGSSDQGISQPRILEWVSISSSRRSSRPRGWTHVSCIGWETLLLSHLGSPFQVAIANEAQPCLSRPVLSRLPLSHALGRHYQEVGVDITILQETRPKKDDPHSIVMVFQIMKNTWVVRASLDLWNQSPEKGLRNFLQVSYIRGLVCPELHGREWTN